MDRSEKFAIVGGVAVVGGLALLGYLLGSSITSRARVSHSVTVSAPHSVTAPSTHTIHTHKTSTPHTTPPTVTIINPSNSFPVRIVYNNTHVDLKPGTQTTIKPTTNIIVEVLIYRYGLLLPFYCYTISPPFPSTITINVSKVSQCYVNVSHINGLYPEVISSQAIWR